ncbi:MAG: sugar transferase [Acidobacteria bacterium]|nr:sugar transferase [Acidobacteriota bacterium]
MNTDYTIAEHRPAERFSNTPIRVHPCASVVKRGLDVGLSGVMLVLSSPISLLMMLAIKLEDGGPVFYRQERWGRGVTRFSVYKFRTMIADSDERFGVQQARSNDQRITRVGRVLRGFGLDELPQLLNILKGDMSFVGPRALAVGEIVTDEGGNLLNYEHVPGFDQRLVVCPGLTGLATIYLPKDAAPRRKFRYDLHYVRHRSLFLDLKLIALSFWISFRGKWETRGKKV